MTNPEIQQALDAAVGMGEDVATVEQSFGLIEVLDFRKGMVATLRALGESRAVLEWLATHYKEPGDEEADEEFVRDIGMDGAVLVQLYSDEEIYSAELAMKRLIDLLESEDG